MVTPLERATKIGILEAELADLKVSLQRAIKTTSMLVSEEEQEMAHWNKLKALLCEHPNHQSSTMLRREMEGICQEVDPSVDGNERANIQAVSFVMEDTAQQSTETMHPTSESPTITSISESISSSSRVRRQEEKVRNLLLDMKQAMEKHNLS